MTNDDETGPALFELAPAVSEIGPVEAAVDEQLARLHEAGYVDVERKGQAQLARSLARKLDRGATREKLYAYAQAALALHSVLEALPMPEVQQGSELDDAIAKITAAAEAEQARDARP